MTPNPDPYKADPFRRRPKVETPVEPPKPKAPTGTAKEILAWVDDDVDRAKLALEAEQANDKPRAGLVRDLKAVVDAADADDESKEDADDD